MTNVVFGILFALLALPLIVPALDNVIHELAGGLRLARSNEFVWVCGVFALMMALYGMQGYVLYNVGIRVAALFTRTIFPFL